MPLVANLHGACCRAAVGCAARWLCSALLCWRGRADGGRSDSAECEPTGAREARLERLLACVRDFLREAV